MAAGRRGSPLGGCAWKENHTRFLVIKLFIDIFDFKANMGISMITNSVDSTLGFGAL
jgi:hypothetical protein